MFGKIRSELNGIRLEIGALTKALRIASDGLRDSQAGGADHERLSALEGRIETVMGVVEAGLIKAEALKATARAAEDRMRGHEKRAEASLELAKSIENGEDEDPFERAAEAYASVVPAGDEEAGEELPGLHAGLDSRRARRQMVRDAKRR